MKPCYLEFCGVNSFSEPAIIDFTSLLEFGIFGIFGDTGSGKSTVLDCIGFALYGNVARSRTGSIADIINYRSDKAYVNFEFEIAFEGARRRFRVERELKRKNAVQSVRVYERKDGELAALGEGVRECNALLERIIGLEQKDFEKCIALPQGEFAQFVKAQRADRLKLVSRLFDLEEYGEKLIKKANARAAELRSECEVLSAKLEPFAEVSAEKLAALEEEIKANAEKEKNARTALDDARARAAEAAERMKKRREAEETEKRLAVLDGEKEEIDALEKELGRLSYAEAVSEAGKESGRAARAAERAAREADEIAESKARAEEALRRTALFDAEKAEAEIERLTDLKARADQAAETKARYAALAARLEKTRREYAEELKNFRGFSYEEEREKLRVRKESLGDENFFEFAETHGKAELLRGEYASFAEELRQVGQKNPQTAEDVRPLAEKYAALSAGEKTDFSHIRAAYEERERERAACRKEELELEKRNGQFRAHAQRLSQLQTEGLQLKEEAEALQKSLDATLPAREEVEKELALRRREKKESAEARERASERLAKAAADLAAAEEKRRSAIETLSAAREREQNALARGKFASAEEADALVARFGDTAAAEAKIKAYRAEYAALSARRNALAGEDLSGATEETVRAVEAAVLALEKEVEETVRALALEKSEQDRVREALGRKKELEKECERARRRAEIFERLKKLLDGNKFMEFVAEEYLQSVTENGSRRLLSLTSGRYFLRYDGGFLVGDNLNGGSLRGVYTLSGGETFLVSLSLALALSSEICNKSLRPIEFFFLDEGFGTLDERLVDTVMDSLEKLKSEHFSIGIISHVEELKHRIDRKLTVEKATEKHGSRIRA